MEEDEHNLDEVAVGDHRREEGAVAGSAPSPREWQPCRKETLEEIFQKFFGGGGTIVCGPTIVAYWLVFQLPLLNKEKNGSSPRTRKCLMCGSFNALLLSSHFTILHAHTMQKILPVGMGLEREEEIHVGLYAHCAQGLLVSISVYASPFILSFN
ncbi:hypothetical protein CFC21_112218 [Triticum aestivum]|uniref:Uncharacterized protein n=2 Tax=Triticum aestivum TaxID=4565 RepID=A0A9R0GKP8_WHEAT|nr:hypothetical protein [Triticum aestivum]